MNVNLLSGKFNMAAVYLATPNMSQVSSKYQKEIKRLNLFFSQIMEILKVTFPKLHQLSSVDSSQNNLMKIWRSDLFKRTLDPVKKAMRDAEMDITSVNDIVLVGGSIRIPKIQKLLQELLMVRSSSSP